jgi:hypothetical protein
MEHVDCGDTKGGSATDIAYSLRGMKFPAENSSLKDHALRHSANKVVMDRLDKIEDRVYESIADVTTQVGKAA